MSAESVKSSKLSNPFNELPPVDEPPSSSSLSSSAHSNAPEVDTVREPDIKIILLGDSAVGKSK
jgi:hypothetical protein